MMTPSRTMHDLPDDERPRERLAQHGAGALKTSELLAILLRTGRQGASALDIGEELVDRFGGIENLGRATVAELAGVKGVGMAKAVQLVAAFALGARLSRTQAETRRIQTPKDVCALLGDEMRLLRYESIRMILLSSRRDLIAVEEISRGLVDQAVFHPREGLRMAIARDAAAVIMVHNHPSGDSKPSIADRQITKVFSEAAALMQIPLVDHIILGSENKEGRDGYFSFKENGLL